MLPVMNAWWSVPGVPAVLGERPRLMAEEAGRALMPGVLVQLPRRGFAGLEGVVCFTWRYLSGRSRDTRQRVSSS